MKKVLLFAYSKQNFGDDLFIYILANRYKEVQFYIHISDENYKRPFINIKNINFLDEERDVRKVNIDNFDAFVYIGGSIFIESEYSKHEVKEFNYFICECNKKDKPFFYLGCNFGPYNTKEYLDMVRENFKLSSGVCLRDHKSYKLFKDIPTVSFAPDMALTYNVPEIDKKNNEETIGISVINLENREKLRNKLDIYNDYISRIIIKFAKRGYKVYLISFCDFEEDNIAIDKIKKTVPSEYMNNVYEILYNGNIDEFIHEYSKINYMVCTRFHSMILSIIARQKIYNLCYSEKQENMIKDFKLFRKIDNIRKIDFTTKLRKYHFKRVNNRKCLKLQKDSIGQFKNFDEWLRTY